MLQRYSEVDSTEFEILARKAAKALDDKIMSKAKLPKLSEGDVCSVHGLISIIDHENFGEMCKCGGAATGVTLTIHGTDLELCSNCLIDVIRCAADGLN